MNKVTKISDKEYTVGLFTVKVTGDTISVNNTIIKDDDGEEVELETLKEAILEKVHEYLKTTQLSETYEDTRKVFRAHVTRDRERAYEGRGNSNAYTVDSICTVYIRNNVMKEKIYHGVKGERISMVSRQNRGKSMLIGPTYVKQQARDLVYAIGMMVIGIVLVGLILL